jgi:lysophospholipase L1-like esterase
MPTTGTGSFSFARGVLFALALGLLACGSSNAAQPGLGPSPARDSGPAPGTPTPTTMDGSPASGSDASRLPPAASDASGPADAGTPPPPATGTRPAPTRLIILGDSIVACLGVGDKNGPACSPNKLHQYLAAGVAPGISYENEAVSGAQAADVPAQQLPRVHGGPGHALVVVFVGGNDLRPYMIASDTAAAAGFATVTTNVTAAWTKVFAFFADKARFPDGTTVLVNNQYDPFDGCTAPPFFVSPRKAALLGTYNDLLAKLARESGGVLIDQFSPYLGHGHHYAVASCPHYQKGAQPFMNDLIHPNVAGHNNLFLQWKQVVDGFYGTR